MWQNIYFNHLSLEEIVLRLPGTTNENREEIEQLQQEFLNLGTNYKQSTVSNTLSFAEGNDWEYTPGPKEIDIQMFPGNVQTYLNEYIKILNAVNKNSFDESINSLREIPRSLYTAAISQIIRDATTASLSRACIPRR